MNEMDLFQQDWVYEALKTERKTHTLWCRCGLKDTETMTVGKYWNGVLGLTSFSWVLEVTISTVESIR